MAINTTGLSSFTTPNYSIAGAGNANFVINTTNNSSSPGAIELANIVFDPNSSPSQVNAAQTQLNGIINGASSYSQIGSSSSQSAFNGAITDPSQLTSVVNNPLQSFLPSSGSGDIRARLACLNKSDYGSSSIFSPIIATNGMLFPYTPTINYQQDIQYGSQSLIHTNADIEYYQRTPSVTLQVSGKFTVQNTIEGQYAFAAIHFLRSMSKMWFGEKAGSNAGLPPPLLVFSANGNMMFNKLTCILKTHSYTFDNSVDYIDVPITGSGIARLPVLFEISLSLVVQQSQNQWRTQFDLNAFKSGALLQSGGWI